MSTNDNMNPIVVQTELDKLNSDILVGESIVNGARDRYASELCGSYSIERMLSEARTRNRTYKLPKRLNKRGGWFTKVLNKIKIVFGIV